MPVLWVFAMCAFLLQIGLLSTEVSDHLAPDVVARASDEVDHYRAFLYLADLYMKTQSAPSATTAPRGLTAKDLLSSLGVDHGLSLEAFPSNWRVVLGTNATWATCTPMSEEAMGMVAQLVRTTSTGPKMHAQSIQGKNAWVISEATSEASLCQ